MLTDEIDISRGDLLLAADEALPAVQSASVDVVWMAEQPLSPGQSYDIKIAGKKTRARVDGIDVYKRQLPYNTEINWHSESIASCRLALSLTAAITGFWRSRCKRGINYPYYLSKAVGDAESGRRIAPLL